GSVGGAERGGRGEGAPEAGHAGRVRDLSQPFGQVGAPAQYALLARRHMHEYGTTSEQFGAIAVACRKHASLNPNASYRTPITIEDHQNSRMIAEPFHLLDCCPQTIAA